MSAEGATSAILARLTQLHPKVIDLSLGRIERLLARLGNPHHRLPPVFHVAGTNGKGSTCAFLQAMLTASGHRVHVYTSPHLVRFNERIRLAGELISDDALAMLLDECERANDGAPITFFEITTAAAFLAFSRLAADALVLEVGLGGRLDATNVIERPLAALITPVDYDHQAFLGDTLEAIGGEKAGIIKRGAPVIAGPQHGAVNEVLRRVSAMADAPLTLWGEGFSAHEEKHRMVFEDRDGLLDLPMPKLKGAHQISNAALAIAALRTQTALPVSDKAIEQGLETVSWPARMQRLTYGPLIEDLPSGSELWLDGGHNPHGGAAIAAAVADLEDARPRPLYLIVGMLETKDAGRFLAQFRGLARHVTTLTIPGEAAALGAGALYDLARAQDFAADPAENLDDAIMQVIARAAAENGKTPPRILICGSLRLAGLVLRQNG